MGFKGNYYLKNNILVDFFSNFFLFLQALEKIPKNTFICTYRGEVVTSEDALKRQAESPSGDKYFFNLDYTKDLHFKYVVRIRV